MGLHLSSFYDSLNSSPGILIESDFSLSYSSPCQPKESDLSFACHFQNRSPAVSFSRLCRNTGVYNVQNVVVIELPVVVSINGFSRH